jgi:hypothetical protein
VFGLTTGHIEQDGQENVESAKSGMATGSPGYWPGTWLRSWRCRDDFGRQLRSRQGGGRTLLRARPRPRHRPAGRPRLGCRAGGGAACAGPAAMARPVPGRWGCPERMWRLTLTSTASEKWSALSFRPRGREASTLFSHYSTLRSWSAPTTLPVVPVYPGRPVGGPPSPSRRSVSHDLSRSLGPRWWTGRRESSRPGRPATVMGSTVRRGKIVETDIPR